MWLSVRSKVQIVCIWFNWCHCHPRTPLSLAAFISRLVLPFWYQLTQVVQEKRPLNGCCSSSLLRWTLVSSQEYECSNNCYVLHFLNGEWLVTFYVKINAVNWVVGCWHTTVHLNIRLMMALQTVGVYAIIDEESKFPRATDLTLMEKMTKTFTRQPEFQRVKNQNLQFIIQHFAGPVRVSLCIKCTKTKVFFISHSVAHPIGHRRHVFDLSIPTVHTVHSTGTRLWASLRQSTHLSMLEFYNNNNNHLRPFVPSVLWRRWLGGRKGIRPVKNRVVGYWRGYLSGARCRLAYGPADATATHCLLLQ